MHRRYGRFNPKDFLGYWICSLFTIIFILGGILNGFYQSSIMAFAIIIPYTAIAIKFSEKFCITDSHIFVKRWCETEEIPIPSKMILIFSLTDFSLSGRRPIEKGMDILKGQYSVSIINPMPTNDALKILHSAYNVECTTATVWSRFYGNGFVYSFVCNEELLEQLTRGREYTAIVPKTLVQKLPFQIDEANIYLDNRL